MQVLIVDDSQMVRNAVARIFGNEGFQQTFLAKDGEEAVEIFLREQIDFVTLDITMPEMDGLQCVRKLVQLKPQVPILVISSLEDSVTAVEMIKRGAKGFLTKPFTDKELVEAIHEVLAYGKGTL
ncbi:MAG: response regulator [Verrucomicrobiales bacterium]